MQVRSDREVLGARTLRAANSRSVRTFMSAMSIRLSSIRQALTKGATTPARCCRYCRARWSVISDGRYIVVRNRLCRRAESSIGDAECQVHIADLMKAAAKTEIGTAQVRNFIGTLACNYYKQYHDLSDRKECTPENCKFATVSPRRVE